MSDTAMPLRHNSRVRLPSVLRLIRRAHSGHLRSIAEKMTSPKSQWQSKLRCDFDLLAFDLLAFGPTSTRYLTDKGAGEVSSIGFLPR